MAIRFQKRIKIAPGVRLNLSKSTASITAGAKGASVNIGKDGKNLNLGLPGTGLSSRTKIGDKATRADIPQEAPPSSAKEALLGGIAVAAIGLIIWWLAS